MTEDLIKGENPDLSHITKSLNTLPTTGPNGSSITWVSDSPALVINDQQTTIVRPDFKSGNQKVTLTAIIIKKRYINNKSSADYTESSSDYNNEIIITDAKIFSLTILKNAHIKSTGSFEKFNSQENVEDNNNLLSYTTITDTTTKISAPSTDKNTTNILSTSSKTEGKNIKLTNFINLKNTVPTNTSSTSKLISQNIKTSYFSSIYHLIKTDLLSLWYLIANL